MSTVKHFSFAGGELAPSLYARTDQVKYQTGARVLKNTYVPRVGGAFNRPGTQFVCEIPGTDAPRLIPFIFNDTNTYVLIFADGQMLVVKNGAYVNDSVFGSKTIVGITKGAQTIIEVDSDTNLAGTYMVNFENVGGMTELNGRNFKVTNIAGSFFRIEYVNGGEVDSTAFNDFTSCGTVYRTFSLTHTYSTSALADLQFAQSADVMILTHIDYPIKKLTRTSDSGWTLSDYALASDQDPITSASNNGSAGSTIQYEIYGVGPDGEIGESAITQTSQMANSTNTVVLSFNTTTTAAYYAVLRNNGYIGATATNTFVDAGQTPQWFDQIGNAPLSEGEVFQTATPKRAATVGFYQQRLLFGNLSDNFSGILYPETIVPSFIGHYYDFFSRGPIADNDNNPFKFDIAGRRINEIRHLVDLERLVVFTADGVHVAQGDEAGALTPTTINLKRVSSTGAAKLRPLICNESLLYLEARRSIIRDLNFQIQTEGYKGNDVTIFAKHLFDGHTLEDWDYQLNPDSILFGVREDGVLLGLTYVKEQQIVAWHRHTFTACDSERNPTDTGLAEALCCIPESNQDVLYVSVSRQNEFYLPDLQLGKVRRFLERLVIDPIEDIKDCKYADAYLSYDGRNDNDAHNMQLTGGTDWTYLETLTLTSDVSYFTADDVGNEIQLTGSDGTLIRFRILAYTDANTVTGKAHKTVPLAMQGALIATWAKAVDEISGLWHLEGYKVSVFGDGYVVGSPNNPRVETTYIVQNGAITLSKCYAVIHVGLPYVSDIEPLDIDSAQGETLADKNKLIGKVTVWVENTRGVFVGNNPNDPTSLEGLTEFKTREQEEWAEPNQLATGTGEIIIQPEWNSHGRVLLRQVDPLPMRINAIAPAGRIPFRG